MNRKERRKGTILMFESLSTSLQERLQEDAYQGARAVCEGRSSGHQGNKDLMADHGT